MRCFLVSAIAYNQIFTELGEKHIRSEREPVFMLRHQKRYRVQKQAEEMKPIFGFELTEVALLFWSSLCTGFYLCIYLIILKLTPIDVYQLFL